MGFGPKNQPKTAKNDPCFHHFSKDFFKNEPNSTMRLGFFFKLEIIHIWKNKCPYEPLLAKFGVSGGVKMVKNGQK